MASLMKIAHRGYSARFSENTMSSFMAAVEAGADMIELDVHLSRDGELVVIHDNFVDRTSNGSGAVKDLALSELRLLDFDFMKTSNLAFVSIPTLKEVIDAVRGRLMLNIEIKNCPYRYPGIEEALIGLLKEKDFLDDAIVSSFDHYSLLKVQRLCPGAKTGMLYDAVWLNFAREIDELGLYSIHPSVDAIDAEQLRLARSRGLRVYTWVAHDRKTVDRLAGAGLVDGIMVNDLSLLQPSS